MGLASRLSRGQQQRVEGAALAISPRVMLFEPTSALDPEGLSEDEAIALLSVGVDFGVTQVVDGNWGVHAVIKKSLFAS